MTLKRSLEFLIYSNIWIASCACSLTLLFYLFFKIQVDFISLAFVFLSTLFIYTWQRFVKIKSDQPFSGKRLEWMLSNLKYVQVSLIFSGIASLFFLLLLQVSTLKILIPFGVIAFLYVGKFPLKKLISLRDIPFLKAHFVAGIWAGISVIFPSFQSNIVLTNSAWIFFAAIYCFILSLAIIFDLRDADLDEPQKRTIPQLVGKRGAVVVAIIFNLIASSLLAFLQQELFFTLIFFSLISAVLFAVALKRKDDFFFSFWIDALILIFSVTLIFRILF